MVHLEDFCSFICNFRCCTTNTWWSVLEEDGRLLQVTYWSMTRAGCCRSLEWMGKLLQSRASLRPSGTWIQTIIWLFLPITKPRRRLSEISFSCDWDSIYVGPNYFLKCSKFSLCFKRTSETFRLEMATHFEDLWIVEIFISSTVSFIANYPC